MLRERVQALRADLRFRDWRDDVICDDASPDCTRPDGVGLDDIRCRCGHAFDTGRIGDVGMRGQHVLGSASPTGPGPPGLATPYP